MPEATTARIGLTSLQSGMVYHYLREGKGRGTDVVQVEVHLGGEVDVERLRDAWAQVMAREPMLRTGARWEGVVEPEGWVASTPPLEFEVVELESMDRERREARYRELLHQDERRGFELDSPPLMRVALYRMAADDVRMVWTLHHFIADGWSYTLVLDDVFRIHDGEATDPEPRPSFERFVEWLDERDGSGDRAFWKGLLEGVPEPAPLPGERTQPDGGEIQPRVYLHDHLDADELARARTVAAEAGATLNTLIQGAWALTLSRFGMGDDLVFGAIRGGRAGTIPDAREIIGLFIQTLPIRVKLQEHDTLESLLGELRRIWVEMRAHEHVSISDVQRWSGVQAGSLLFRSVLNVQDPFWGDALTTREGPWAERRITLHNRLVYPLVVAANAGEGLDLRFEFDPSEMEEATVRSLLSSFVRILRVLVEDPTRPLARVDALPEGERERLLTGVNPAIDPEAPSGTVHGAIEARAHVDPDAPAVHFGDLTWSRGELEARANRIAHGLVGAGVRSGDRVGIAMERGPAMVAAMLGAMKAGAAYVPIDPHYPAERVRLMVEDAELAALLTEARLTRPVPEPGIGGSTDPRIPDDTGVRLQVVDDPAHRWEEFPATSPERGVAPDDLAYMIYTSGSTGRPKGVMVEHRNVLNFFDGMDQVVGDPAGKRWLAVTSISFDISVLELLWTLARGAEVVIHPERERVPAAPADGSSRKVGGARARRPGATAAGSAGPDGAGDPDARPATMDFSLFYFSAEGGEGEEPPPPGRHRYRLLLEGSKIADEGGLSAIWTPERHFHEFGGIYPNPSVAGAAVAAITRRIRIRAGSVVLPLHDTIRVAEEWSVVDNLCDGRVDLSFASGWHDRDFIFAPENFEDRREVMFREIETLRALWRGESVMRTSPKAEVELALHPRPVQAELPFWVTAGGSPETFRRAGEVGGSLLTHLLGQSPDDLEEKIAIYRQAWRDAGHPGRGHVSLMLHTYIGETMEEVLERVRTPFRNYLSTSVGLIKAMAQGDGRDLQMAELSEEDMEALLDHAFNRYFETSALMGTMEANLEMAVRLRERDVDEIACLADFGVEEDATLESIARIPELMERTREALRERRGDVVGVEGESGAEAESGAGFAAATEGADAGSIPVHADDAPTPADTAFGSADPGSLPDTVGEAIRRYGITHLQCTPSAIRLILAEADPGLEALETLLVGGEAFPGALATVLGDRIGEGRILNMYGPTETTIWSSVCEVDEAAAGESVVPLGEPIRNTALLVVDEGDRLVPVGVPGELLIGGHGVVRGYFQRPGLTGERFVHAPTSGFEGRLYRTGDRVMRRADGRLVFLGRIDHQVKIRGHRIELGEIEAALEEIEGIEAAVTHVWTDDEGTSDRLVAYLRGPNGIPRADTLRSHLAQRLPDVMIPQEYIELAEFPLTPNRKVDRKRLPRPEVRKRPSGEGVDAPRSMSDLQRLIGSVWADALGVDQVGLDDNFFDLGGHSLLTVRVHGRLSGEHGLSVTITDLFRHPTVRALAGHLEQEEDPAEALSGSLDRAAARRGALGQRRRRRKS